MKVLMLLIMFTGGMFMTQKSKTNYDVSENGFKKFVAELKAKIKPLDKKITLADWNAAVTGKDNYFKESEKYSLQRAKIYHNKADFKYLKTLKKKNLIKDPILKRELEVIYNYFLEKQIDPKLNKQISELETKITKIYYHTRTDFRGKKITKNDVSQILKTSKDPKERKEAWIAQKKIGEAVYEPMMKLVALRNKAAKELGFDNFYDMRLALSEQNTKDLLALFDRLDKVTREPFKKIKAQMDKILAKRYGYKEVKLHPWDYEDLYFQEGQSVFDVDLDSYYKNVDIVKVAENYYKSLGMDLSEIIKKSSLYEKPGKNQHAFCTTIDPDTKDVRVLTNIKQNAQWMGTILHELGHAAYEKYISPDLPYFLKTPAHMFTTESVAMTFGKLSQNPYWMEANLHINKKDAKRLEKDAFKSQQLAQLIFARWVLVMVNFEHQLYSNPKQDLNKLWWDLVEKYQMVNRPENRNEPDWATKDHICLYPVYYHNYMLGELMSAQVHHYIAKNIYKEKNLLKVHYTGSKKTGQYFINKIFVPGNKYRWDKLILKATGEKLTPDYFVSRFAQ